MSIKPGHETDLFAHKKGRDECGKSETMIKRKRDEHTIVVLNANVLDESHKRRKKLSGTRMTTCLGIVATRTSCEYGDIAPSEDVR